MTGYREPGFQDRVAAAGKARAGALARLKARAPLDPAVVAGRLAKAQARETAQALAWAQRAETHAMAQLAKAAAIAQAVIQAAVPPVTEADLKAARDARYAARKARKS